MRVTLDRDHYLISCTKTDLKLVRSLPERKFDPARLLWIASATKENYDHLKAGGYRPPGSRPTASAYRVVGHESGSLLVYTPPTPQNVLACRNIPDKRTWNPNRRCWSCKPTIRNVEYLLRAFPLAVWDERAGEEKAKVKEALAVIEEVRQEKRALQEWGVSDPGDFPMVTKPFAHQEVAFALSRNRENFALLMEQGTGKTKVIIDTARWLHAAGKIDGVLVICPNSVKSNWVQDEIPLHHGSGFEAFEYRSTMSKRDRDTLEGWLIAPNSACRYLVMNVEGLGSSAKAVTAAGRFVKNYRALVVVDESSRIKTPAAKRTRAIIKLGQRAHYRRIMTGTLITNSPLDAFAQFKYLDPDILGFGAFYAFRNHFAVMIQQNGFMSVARYQHLDELQSLIDPFSFRVLKEDCLDLPPKVYQKRVVELSKEQRLAYSQMVDKMETVLGDGVSVTATIVLTQLLRLQQIVGGFVTVDPAEEESASAQRQQRVLDPVVIPLPGPNPKAQALLEVLEETNGKAIIWARFRAEIALISEELRRVYGDDSVVEFHGGVKEDARTEARQRFQDPASPTRFFVANPAAGGLGITLTAATTVVYYSNSFSLEERLQSEDRAHRIGQDVTVTYIDLVCKNTIDVKVLSSHREKKSLADQVMGDRWREWI